MARVENVKDILCDVVAQAMGADYYPTAGTSSNKDLHDTETYKLADVGKDIDEADKVDVVTKALVVRIGKVRIDKRKVPYVEPSILKDKMEFGGAQESIRLGLYEVQNDPSWELTDGKNYASYDYTYHQPNVSARLYDDRISIYIVKSTTRRQLKEAFLSWEAMESFVDGIAIAWDNTLRVTINSWTRALMSCAIAVSDKATGTARHLLTEAKALKLLAEDATAEDFRNNKACLEYTFEQIRNVRKYMSQDMTVAFNDKSIPCVTPSEDCRLTLLSDFASRIKTIRANTFNDNELGFGDFNEVTSWQGIASTTESVTSFYEWDNISSVKISADANNKLGIGTDAYNQSNIIGLMWDYLSMGVCPYDEYITSNYAAGADFWNDHGHYTANKWLDTRYNIVAWIID